jgi:hypothetical protein
MTTLKRRVLISSLAAAGMLASSGATLAADLDVSSIYGRGAPPNAHIRADATSPTVTQTSRSTTNSDSTASEYRSAAVSEPEVAQAYPEHASHTIYPYPATTPGQETYAEDSSGRIHEENLDGAPLVDGRGMRQGVDVYAAAPVYADPAFDVADILGRASPPAPENAPDFGQPS